MTGTNCDLFTHKYSRSYLNHLVYRYIITVCLRSLTFHSSAYRKDASHGLRTALPWHQQGICNSLCETKVKAVAATSMLIVFIPRALRRFYWIIQMKTPSTVCVCVMFHALPTFVIYSCCVLTPDNWATLNTWCLAIQTPRDLGASPGDSIHYAPKFVCKIWPCYWASKES
jgi:hypothetical protein